MALSRVLEPEVMDSSQEAISYDTMDHREVNARFAEDFLKASSELFQSRGEEDYIPVTSLPEILDLGTGTAQIPLLLCRLCSDYRIVAIDLAVEMLEIAKRKVELAGLRDRILLQHIDAKRLPYANGKFAAVISNSIVHHIPEPVQVLREAFRVSMPGGLIFVRDLLRPEGDAEVRKLVETYAGSADEYQQGLFDASLRAALTLDEIRSMVTSLGGPAESVQATSDRHWTWSMRVPVS